MLFILAIDPLHHLFRVASEGGILQPFRAAPVRFAVSLYADDAGIFVGPEVADMQVVCAILDAFGDATGLRTNLAKSEAFPIACMEEQIVAALAVFPAKAGELPMHIPWPTAPPFAPQGHPLPIAYLQYREEAC
jgi:hypothetical protein